MKILWIYLGINGVMTILWYIFCIWRMVGADRIKRVYEECKVILIIGLIFGIFTIPALIGISIYCLIIDYK